MEKKKLAMEKRADDLEYQCMEDLSEIMLEKLRSALFNLLSLGKIAYQQ